MNSCKEYPQCGRNVTPSGRVLHLAGGAACEFQARLAEVIPAPPAAGLYVFPASAHPFRLSSSTHIGPWWGGANPALTVLRRCPGLIRLGAHRRITRERAAKSPEPCQSNPVSLMALKLPYPHPGVGGASPRGYPQPAARRRAPLSSAQAKGPEGRLWVTPSVLSMLGWHCAPDEGRFCNEINR